MPLNILKCNVLLRILQLISLRTKLRTKMIVVFCARAINGGGGEGPCFACIQESKSPRDRARIDPSLSRTIRVIGGAVGGLTQSCLRHQEPLHKEVRGDWLSLLLLASMSGRIRASQPLDLAHVTSPPWGDVDVSCLLHHPPFPPGETRCCGSRMTILLRHTSHNGLLNA